MELFMCVDNRGYEVSLMLGRVYRTAPRESNDMPSFVRIIDEEGEDYLYPRERFVEVSVATADLDRAFAATAAA